MPIGPFGVCAETHIVQNKNMEKIVFTLVGRQEE
jgi:hypothetical protein